MGWLHGSGAARETNVKENTMHASTKRRLVAVLSTATFVLSASAAQATCKGQAEGVCAADAACTWVGDYVRKDGIAVKGYCRSRGGSSSRAPSAANEGTVVTGMASQATGKPE